MPTAVASVDSDTGAAPFSPNFSWSGSSDNGVSVVRTWSWDDGSSDTVDPAPTTSHTFTDPGTYTVTLTIEDSSGTDTDTLTITVTAGNTPPVAVAAVTGGVTSGDAPFAVVFDGTGSSDADGTIASYAWDFDDGGTSTSSTPSHTFIDPGTYTVTLTVTDDDGATDTDTVTITVTTGDGCDETYTATELIDALDYPYSWSWTGTPPTPILGTPSDAIGGTWSEPAHTGGYVEADAVFSGPYTALTGSHIDISVTIELTAGTAPSGGAGIVAGVGTQAHVAVNRQIRAYEYAFPPFTAPITLTAHYDIPAGDYDAFFAYLNLPMSDGVEFDVSDFVATLCLVTEPNITGGFTADTIGIGDSWTFVSTSTYSGATSPTVTPTWDAALGATASVTINGVPSGTVASGDPIDISAIATPVEIILTGTSTSADPSAALTLVLADGTPLDAVTDTIEIADLPPISGAGVVELELVNELGERSFIDVTDLGIQAGTVSTQRGCSLQGPYFRQDAGRASWTFDNDLGQWDPMVTTNPWWVDGDTLLKKGLRARVFVRHPSRTDGGLVWSGRVTEWPPSYDADRWSEVPVVCLDAVDRLKAASRPALGDPVGAGEGVSARVARILANIGYTADPVGDGDVTLQGTTLAKSAWEELALVADSDGGWLYLDPTGAPRYLKRDWFLTATPALTLSMGGEPGTLEYANPQTTNDTDELYNVLKLARAGGVEQAHVADDADPNDETGYRTYSRDDLLCQTDRQVMDLVLFTIGRTRHARFRFSSVEVPLRVEMDPTEWDLVTDRDFGDIIRIRHTTVDGRVLEVDHILMGVAWPTIDPSRRQWIARFTLAELPAPQPLLEIDGSGDTGVFHLGQHAPWR